MKWNRENSKTGSRTRLQREWELMNADERDVYVSLLQEFKDNGVKNPATRSLEEVLDNRVLAGVESLTRALHAEKLKEVLDGKTQRTLW